MADHPKIIAVVGATASGKSSLALNIAKKYNGELVCADSRQIYRGLDIGSAKDEGEWVDVEGEKHFMVDGVREHLTDSVDPNDDFSVGVYQDMAFKAIDDILSRGKMPVVVGGTGLYIQAITENLSFPDVAPNKILRKRLGEKSLEDLQATYKACDPVGAMSIDDNNRRRLTRAIEVCWVAQKPFSEMQKKNGKKYEVLQLGMEVLKEQLSMRIERRTREMLQKGLVDEVSGLLDGGADVRKSAMTGIGYREVINYLQGDINYEEMVEQIKRNTRKYAKRQMSWFRRDATIRWIEDEEDGLELVEEFMKGELEPKDTDD